MSMRHFLLHLLIANLVVAMSMGLAEAQSRGRSSRYTVKVGAGPTAAQLQSTIQQIDKQLQDLQKPYGEAKKALDKVQQEHHQVALQHKQQLHELSQAKNLAAMTAKSDPARKAALEKLTELQTEMAALRKQVVDSIKDREDYRRAVQLHDDAVAEKQSNSASESDEARKAAAIKVSETALAVRLIEDVAMADRSDFKDLSRKLKEAEAEVAKAAKKAHEIEENDPKVASAKVGFVRTTAALKEADQNLAQAQGAAGGIQQKMQALNRQKSDLTEQQQAINRLTNGGRSSSSTSNASGKR